MLQMKRTLQTAQFIEAPKEKWKCLNEIHAGDCLSSSSVILLFQIMNFLRRNMRGTYLCWNSGALSSKCLVNCLHRHGSADVFFSSVMYHLVLRVKAGDCLGTLSKVWQDLLPVKNSRRESECWVGVTIMFLIKCLFTVFCGKISSVQFAWSTLRDFKSATERWKPRASRQISESLFDFTGLRLDRRSILLLVEARSTCLRTRLSWFTIEFEVRVGSKCHEVFMRAVREVSFVSNAVQSCFFASMHNKNVKAATLET